MRLEGISIPYDEVGINLQYLQARLAFVDLLVQREIRRWQAAGQNMADEFRGLTISEQEAQTLSRRPFGTSWGQTSDLQPEEKESFGRAITQLEEQIDAISGSARDLGVPLWVDDLERVFQLDAFDLDALLIALAPACDLRYERLYGFLQDDVTRKRPTVNLVLNLLCEPGVQRLQMTPHFASNGPLFSHHLVEWTSDLEVNQADLLGRTIQANPTVVAWLLGNYQPGKELEKFVQLFSPEDNQADRLLATLPDPQIDLNRLAQPEDGEPAILIFYGPDQAGQEAAARQCAVRNGRPLLQIDMAAGSLERAISRDSIRSVLRDALLTGALPVFTGWDACLVPGHRAPAPSQGETVEPSHSYSVQAWLLTELFTFPGPMVLSGQSFWQVLGFESHPPLYWLEFPAPDFLRRKAIWEEFLEMPAAEERMELDMTALAGQFALNGGQIRDAIAWARDKAAQFTRPVNEKDLFLAARIHSNSYLGGLAHKIVPHYGWNDFILPEDRLSLLREIIATVRSRPLVLEGWGVGRKLTSSSGIPILFSGPPGTGKTMAAEVIANELGLDLYKIDLSTVVSKYIGETEKNLESIFNEAETSNAILFFDEADAIFGKRSEVKDAHDRYANIEISFLLQRMERYNGIAILATNLRANLDDAFTRRLQFAVDFPFPDEEHRLRIWQTLFPSTVPHESDLDFSLLARQFKLAGGNIRNIIVGAAYLAAADGLVVNMDHVKHSIRRELQKMGRLVNEKEMKLLGESSDG